MARFVILRTPQVKDLGALGDQGFHLVRGDELFAGVHRRGNGSGRGFCFRLRGRGAFTALQQGYILVPGFRPTILATLQGV